ncbi:MAG: transglutaminase family protein [Actinobacteria bacterium]|nr:transglutaminase family protein [Actinomycetota bacterium]
MPTGRKLRIIHRSGYRYSTDVQVSFNEVRMTPADGGGQQLLEHVLSLKPDALVYNYEDYWGAQVDFFDVHKPHRMLEVTAESLVVTPGDHTEARGAPWEEVLSPEVQDRHCEYLAPTEYVNRPGEDQLEILAELEALATPKQVIRAVVDLVHERMTYTPGATTVFTSASEAWSGGIGVCQDFTHVALSLLRALRIPARYVSGYLHSEEPALGQTVVGESHAWIEVWDGAWEGFDPTNNRSVGSAHVKVAAGRDYRDVPPLKGLYSGGGSEALGVTVEITQLED